MNWSQLLIVSWIQFVLAAAILLLTARAAMRWIVQPADRIRLIQCTMAAVLAVPLLTALAPWPVWRVGLVSTTPIPGHRAETNHPMANTGRAESVPRPNVPPDRQVAFASDDGSASIPRGFPSAQPATAPTPEPATPPQAHDRWFTAAVAICAVHAIAALFFLVEWGVGCLRLRQLTHSAMDAPPTVSEAWTAVAGQAGGRVRLLVSGEITTPLTFGWWRSVVLLPQSIAETGGQPLRYCLAHEWAHIERADILTWHGVWFCQFALWSQPLFWTLRRELRICQDILADGAATRCGADPVDYSVLLVAFARQHNSARLAGALTFLDHPSQLLRRVTMLLQRPFRLCSYCSWKFSLAVGLCTLVACGLCTAVRIDSARANDEKPPQQTQSESQVSELKTERPIGEGSPAALKSPDAPPEYERPEQLTYHCVVVNRATGDPVPNAKVTVERSDSSSGHWPFKVVATTTHVTDGQGKYTVEIPPEQSGIRTLYIQIYAEHENHVRYFGGYSLSMIRKNITVGERPFFERLALAPADHVTGKVLSPTGEPLPGVKLFGFTTTKVRDYDRHYWLETNTADDGSFRLNALQGGVAFFWIMPDDYSIVQKFVELTRSDLLESLPEPVSGFIAQKLGKRETIDLGDIRVPNGIRLSGRVISAEGKPVAGIAINAYHQGTDEALQQYGVLSGIRRGVITDTEGRFTFDPLPPGEYRIVPEDELSDPRRERDLHPLPAVFLSQKAKLTDDLVPPPLEIQAVPHINFHAQYLDSQGKQRSGSEFFINGRLDSQFWSAKARPNQDGSVLVRLPHGIQEVQLSIPTNEHSSLRHRKGRGRPIENHNYNVRLGTLNDDVEGFEIIRYKAPLVVVQAVNEAGEPIRGFEVVAHYAWMKDLENYIATTSGSHISFERQDNGMQRTSQMLPDEEATFTVSASGYESASETLKLPEGEVKDLVLTLKKASQEKRE